LTERILDLDGKVDAQVFELYGIPAYDAEGIMAWLDQDPKFIGAVLNNMQ
jgi:hypothetical protein